MVNPADFKLLVGVLFSDGFSPILGVYPVDFELLVGGFFSPILGDAPSSVLAMSKSISPQHCAAQISSNGRLNLLFLTSCAPILAALQPAEKCEQLILSGNDLSPLKDVVDKNLLFLPF